MVHNYETASYPVLLAGARGYAGLELARLLLRHPVARLEACLPGEDLGFRLADQLDAPGARDVASISSEGLKESKGRFRLAFLATPAEVSYRLAPRLLEQGCRVIDLSGAFRLDPEEAMQVYQAPSTALPALGHAEYGLVPWASPATQAKLIANPGCYATSCLLALLPLLKARLIEEDSLFIDAKSGATGAGRKAAERLLFAELAEECIPYKVSFHPHQPEIERFARKYAGAAIEPVFTPHLLPIRRGLLSSIYARTLPGVTEEQIASAYQSAYSGYPLVSAASWSEGDPALSWQRIARRPRCEIRYRLSRGKLSVFSLIDNLMKGAASQAVENLNRVLDLPVETGLMQEGSGK